MIGENPMPSTVRNMLKILYDRKCGAVVMLSGLVENGTVGETIALSMYSIEIGIFVAEHTFKYRGDHV